MADGIVDDNPAHPAVGAIKAGPPYALSGHGPGGGLCHDQRQPRQNAYNWRRAAEKFEGVELGETAVVVYTGPAIGLEKLADASM